MKKVEQTKTKAVTISVFVATFMAAIEGTIVSTAMPTIVSHLDGIALMNWVFSVFLLTSSIAIPIYGKLSDIYGRKKIFIIATIIFLIGSILCGASQNMEMLILFRVIQGIGAGGILPSTMTIIADIYPAEKRARILGFMGSAWGIAGVFGPLLGGFLVDQLSWHWIFFINVPFGLLTIILISLYFKEPAASKKLPVDYKGAVTFTIALLSLLFGLQQVGETLNWLDPLFLILFLLALILFVIFYRTEKKAVDPLLPFILFKNPIVLISNLIGFFLSAFLIGINVYIPMWAQGMLGHGATIAGFMLAPLSVTWIIGSFVADWLFRKYGFRIVIGIGVFISLLGAGLLFLFPANTKDIYFYLNSALMGLGFGISFTITTVAVQEAVPKTQIGISTATNNLFRNVGQTIGVAILGTVFNSVINHLFRVQTNPAVNSESLNKLISPTTASNLAASLLKPLRSVLYNGLHTVFLALFVCSIAAFLLYFLLPKSKNSL